MVLLALQVRVEKRLVALAPAPEHVVLAAELLGDLDRLLHLRRRIGEDVRVGVGRGAAHVARIGEQVRRAPEEPDARRLLQRLGVRDDPVEIAVRLGKRRALGGDVAVVEAPERRLDLHEELEGRVHAVQGDGDGVLSPVPRPGDRARAERVAAGAPERVPVGNREAHALLQRDPVDELRRIVVPERQGILGKGPLEPDPGNAEMLGLGKLRHGRSRVPPIPLYSRVFVRRPRSPLSVSKM